MVLKQCLHFVNISTIVDYNVRRQAAQWALEQFGVDNVNVWILGPKEEPGFWFHSEEDAVMFILKWL
jgi:hypothetical protein